MYRWVGLIGQIRPIKLISSVASEALQADLTLPSIKSVVKNFFDKSFYSIGLMSHLDVGPLTSVVVNVEKDGQRKNRHTKALIHHKAKSRFHLHPFIILDS